MRSRLRPCVISGCPELSRSGRCERHRRPDTRGTRTQRGYTNAWLRASKKAVKEAGECQRCGATEDLTGDHSHALSQGGPSVPDLIPVLCRKCNSSLGGKLAH